jgi:hypothetical protein
MRITSKMILKMLFHNSIKYKRKDFVAQNAYYHLGSYLKLDKKQEALNAFKMPENAFDLQSRKMSLNYAKLSYEIGNSYQSVPAVLLAFYKISK